MRPQNDLDALFDKYLPGVDRDDTKTCWHWLGRSYLPKPYVRKDRRHGHRVITKPTPQTRVRLQGQLHQPNRLLFSLFIRPLAPYEQLTSSCKCVNPWHQTPRGTPSFTVPPYGSLDDFIGDVIQPTPGFDFDDFTEVWADEISHIPEQLLRAKINEHIQGRRPSTS